MVDITQIGCSCGKTRIEVTGRPFMTTECLCASCRSAAARLETLPGSPDMLTAYGATPCAEYRKDRVKIVRGKECMKEFRLSPEAGSRRGIAVCCNTPLFLEMKGAHWLSLYLHLWPVGASPKPELRTMTADLPDASMLPQDIPNLKSHSPTFYAKLFAAWVAMGFRNPQIKIEGTVDV